MTALLVPRMVAPNDSCEKGFQKSIIVDKQMPLKMQSFY